MQNLSRGKRLDNNEWVYGYSYCDKTSSAWYVLDENDLTKHEVSEQSIGRYIGFTDIENQIIFEGDFLFDEVLYILKFGVWEHGDNEFVGFYCESIEEKPEVGPIGKCDGPYMVVVGNFIDSPEWFAVGKFKP